jgi:threonine dehydrogenase-like Zn-dependent dehydrogenase
VDDPAPAGDQAALVRPLAAATCDFDHLMVAGRMPARTPMAIGHECVAEVVDVGPAVRSVVAGQRVVVPFQISCGRCANCRRGATSSCAVVPWLSCYGLGPAGGPWGGVVSDTVVVPYADAMLVALPDGCAPADLAAVGCNVVDAFRCVAPQLQVLPGADVLVLAGAFDNIAVYAAALARACGAGEVHVVTDSEEVAARAGAAGATPVSSYEVGRDRYPIVVDASMDPHLLRLGLMACAPGGVATLSTMYAGRSTEVPLMRMFERCITLHTGQPHARALLDPVLAMVVEERIDLAALTTSTRPWSEAPQAFAAGSGKHVVVVEGQP